MKLYQFQLLFVFVPQPQLLAYTLVVSNRYKIQLHITMNADSLIGWNVMIDIGFWSRLAKKKIQEYQLEAKHQPLIARFRLSNRPEKISILSIDAFSFALTDQDPSGPVDYKVQGTFLNTNTIEEFNAIVPQEKEQQLLVKQLERFKRWSSGQEVGHLYQIFLLIFADLKKHTFTYQFYSTAYPVAYYKVIAWNKCNEELLANNEVRKSVSDHLKALTHPQKKEEKEQEGKEKEKPTVFPQLTVLRKQLLEQNNKQKYVRSSITEFLQFQAEYLFVIMDSTNLPNKTGYHTLTVLAFFAWLRKEGKIKSQRLTRLKLLLVKDFLTYNYIPDYGLTASQVVMIDASEIELGKFEERVKHKKGRQDIDLKSFMDERTLAREAVDLNIKLMKWRLLPTLDIPRIQTTKCLLFGAGTLGCQLARNLIGWGVKNITFIDYSKVSYSNPVRQTLYEYEDTLNGGKPKAETAAQKLRKIYPQINARGFSFSIPMPGHYVRTEQQVKQTFKNLDLLEELVESHDVLFLLLDSREARWLPTVLANKYDKACITVGLGFDSFLIVRHGISPKIYKEQKHGERLCCYFCNDIVTPQNTMKDRTLDQMCTVTKPGLSFISAAYAAELYISLLHHPLRHHAPASQDPSKLQTTDLGKLPHHLRGNLSDFETSIFYGKAFNQCVACSEFILKRYEQERQGFMLNVLNDPSFIHDVTGLKEELAAYEKMEDGIVEILDDQLEFITNSNPASQE